MSYKAPHGDTVGFEFSHNLAGFAPNPVQYILKPNTEFKKGMLVGMAPQSSANAYEIFPWINTTRIDQNILVGVMAEDIKQADNPATGLTYGMVYDNPYNVYNASFIPGANGSIAVLTDATHTTVTSIKVDEAFDNNNRVRGALIYFYDGPNAGQLRTIASTDATNDKLVWTKPLPQLPTPDSKFYVTCHAGLDTAGAVANVGSVGVSADATSRKILTNVALNAAQQPIIVVGVNPVEMTFKVMFAGQLKGK